MDTSMNEALFLSLQYILRYGVARKKKRTNANQIIKPDIESILSIFIVENSYIL